MPDGTPDELHLPELAMMLATDLAVLDHADGSLLLVANAVNYDATDERVEQAWQDAVDRLDAMTADLGGVRRPARSRSWSRPAAQATSNHTPEQFHAMVEAGKEAIRAGEVFQVVLSQRFSVDCPADALDVYRVLRTSNPSPYMYLLRLPAPDGTAYDVVGSSPGGAGQGDRPPGDHPPDRRLPAPRGTPPRRTSPTARTCWPTPRSAPST